MGAADAGATSGGNTRDGFDVSRVVEVIVRREDGKELRASGYRISDMLVLTAAHVITKATEIIARWEADQPGQCTVRVTPHWHDDASDLAVLEIVSVADPAEVPHARFARLGERRAVIAVNAAGFPQWKLRRRPDGRRYRDLADVHGSVTALSNRRSGTLEIVVEPPADVRPEHGSPWQAMSGAAVWSGPYIIGVVARQHPREGSNRLNGVRIDRHLGDTDPLGRSLAEVLEVAEPEALPDVSAAAKERRLKSGYLELVRDIAPAHGLHDRTHELDELAAFCAGSQPYLWLQAGPWAGKSALLSTFVLNPPAGVDVLAFFITARLAAQRDSDAFTDALLEQLSVLLNEPLPVSLSRQDRETRRRAWLQAAASRASANKRRLVLVVDALDEDRSATAGSGLASVASLLPKRPHKALSVIVASRPSIPLPADVALDHPLRDVRVQNLAVSPHAKQTGELAKAELAELLAGSDAQQNLLGLVTASGGGLTLSDLAELTTMPEYQLDQILAGGFRRTVAARMDEDSHNPHRLFLFAHETLLAEATRQFGNALSIYRQRIHGWATIYRERRWPPETPMYLLRHYPRILQELGESTRLTALATDSTRHERLLDLTGGDAAALKEIKAAQDLLLDGGSDLLPDSDLVDLSAMARLALRRDAIVDRNDSLPVALPAVWARLGNLVRAESLAMAITHESMRAEALMALVEVLTETGEKSRAEAIAQTIEDPDKHDAAFRGMVLAYVEAGEHDQATRLAALLVGANTRAAVLAEAAMALAKRGDAPGAIDFLNAAERSADDMDDIYEQQWMHVLIGATAGVAGENGRASGLVDDVENIVSQLDFDRQSDELEALLGLLVTAGCTAEAENIGRSIRAGVHRVGALALLAHHIREQGEPEHADRLLGEAAREMLQVGVRTCGVWTVITVATAFANAGDWNSAAHHLTAAVSLALATERDPEDDMPYEAEWVAIARALDRLGHSTNYSKVAVRIARGISAMRNPYYKARAQAALSTAAANVGDDESARQLMAEAEASARAVPNVGERASTLEELVSAAAQIGLYDVAEDMICPADPSWARARAWTALAAIAAAAGDHDRATEAAYAAERATRSSVDRWQQSQDLGDLSASLATVGDLSTAMRIAFRIDDKDSQVEALTAVAQSAAACGDLDAAERVAQAVSRSHGNWHAQQIWASAAAALAANGELDRADEIAALITDGFWLARAKTEMALGAAASGDFDQAARLLAGFRDSENYDQDVWRMVAAVAAAVGQAEQGVRIVNDAPTGARRAAMAAISDPPACVNALAHLVARLSDIGGDGLAHEMLTVVRQICQRIADPDVSLLGDWAFAQLSAHYVDEEIERGLLAKSLAKNRWSMAIRVHRGRGSALREVLDVVCEEVLSEMM